ncbi:MAG: AhpC/TSA family protein [Bacteroidaceae bacterium]|nr:AhpC/TSA family protein [Bacteroidaceae bacterium]
MKKNRVALVLSALLLAGCVSNKSLYTLNGLFEGCDEPMVWLVCGNDVLDSVSLDGGAFVFSGEVQNPTMAWVCTAPNHRMADFECEFILEPGTLVMSKLADAEQYVVKGSRSNDLLSALEQRSVEIVKEYAQSHDMEGIEEEMDRQWNSLLQSGLKDNTDNMFGLYCLRELSYEALEPQEIMDYLLLFPESVKEDRLWKSLETSTSKHLRTTAGKPFMDFTQSDADGRPVTASQVMKQPGNKYLLIDFWASWCGPCMRELPFLKEAYSKYSGKGFQILGVSLDRAREPWIKAMQDNGMNWVNVSDLKYWSNEVAVQYGINSIPSNFLIDCSDGTIVAVGLRGKNLEAKLSELID